MSYEHLVTLSRLSFIGESGCHPDCTNRPSRVGRWQCVCNLNSSAHSVFASAFFPTSSLFSPSSYSFLPPLSSSFPPPSPPSCLLRDRRLKEFFRELPTMTSDKLSIVEHLFFVIGFMFKDDKKFMEDYRCVTPHAHRGCRGSVV